MGWLKKENEDTTPVQQNPESPEEHHKLTQNTVDVSSYTTTKVTEVRLEYKLYATDISVATT